MKAESGVLRRRRKQGATRRVEREPRERSGLGLPGGGRLLRWLGALAALAAIGWGGVRTAGWMLSEGEFPLRRVHVDGALTNLGPEDAERVVKPYLGQNFFRLDMAALHAGFAADPWVERVAVSRRWPDSLRVEYTERVPYAHWGDQEMLDTQSQRFRPTRIRQPGEWPWLFGPAGHEALLAKTYKQAGAAVAPLGLRVTRLWQDARGAWALRLDNGIELAIGREQFAQRLARFVELYPKVLAVQVERIAVVDLRYINGFAVRWRQPAAEAGGKQGAPAVSTAPRTAGVGAAAGRDVAG